MCIRDKYFMNEKALKALTENDGFEVGVGPSIVVVAVSYTHLDVYKRQPETYVVDGKGIIRHQHLGEIRPEHVPVLLAELEKAK